MTARYYLDASIFGGFADCEFEEATNKFFNQIVFKGIKIIYSELTKYELKNAPENIKEFVNNLPAFIFEHIVITEDALNLVDKYIEYGVVDKLHKENALHVAVATTNMVNVFVSWDYKNIVNLEKIRGYNSVNLKYGYPIIDIRTPKVLLDYEEEV